MSQHLKILMVEDEAQQRDVLRFLLKKAGFYAQCVEATDVASAVRALQGEAFDVALVDFTLPDGCALDILHKVSAPSLATPIVIVTAEEDEAVDVATSQAGAADFLLKIGLDADKLRRVIRRAMQRHRREAPPPAPTGAFLPPEIAAAPPEHRFGRFVRVAKVGSGGMAEVFRAWDTRDAQWVALKVTPRAAGDDLLRLTREGVAVAKLSHPGIATIYDIGEAEGRSYVAMQYIDGVTLDTFARGEPREYVYCLRDASLALDHAHRNGIIHRDVKPSNIMVAGRWKPFDQARVRVYVMDFGVVKLRHDVPTAENLVMGTPSYMSPEHIQGHPVDARSDVYSIGATLHHLLTGKPPFEHETFAQAMYKIVHVGAPPLKDAPPRLAAIAARCLERDPAKRYPTASALAEDLNTYLLSR